jgi:hypothetical protein
MEVDVCVPNLPMPSYFFKHDIWSLIQNHRLPKASLIHFSITKYALLDQKGRDDLFVDLRKAALVGSDCIALCGKGKGKNQSMYIRCQCVIIYHGSNVDNVTGNDGSNPSNHGCKRKLVWHV